MALDSINFEDVTMKNRHINCRVLFSRFNGRFRLAQIWLDRKFMEKMQPYVPYKTGVFLTKINAENAGKWGTGVIVVAVPPQGRYLYPGVSPTTGRPFRWTNPNTQPRWGEYTYNTHMIEFHRGVKHILLKGKYPNG